MPYKEMWQNSGLIFRSHPWHGVPIGGNAPNIVTAYIEIVPGHSVKYELDKHTGFLKIDRPQIYSNMCPYYVWYVTSNLLWRKTAEYCAEKTAEQILLVMKIRLISVY